MERLGLAIWPLYARAPRSPRTTHARGYQPVTLPYTSKALHFTWPVASPDASFTKLLRYEGL
ncbi:MAG: hypothetical protein OEY56_02995 [Cyclobacteriaceae bacterium]|nr:hypothetical protein [Cyclobacteriaceae bacterium]